LLAVQTEFPEIAWKPWYFTKTEVGWWEKLIRNWKNDDAVARVVVERYLEHIGRESTKDASASLHSWYTLSHVPPQAIPHIKLLARSKGAPLDSNALEDLQALLRLVYPGHPWNTAQWAINVNGSDYMAPSIIQQKLRHGVEDIVPTREI